MLLNCKKCRSEVEALIEENTEKVFCCKCNGEILGISPFVKKAMSDMGRVKKENKLVPYGTSCPSCKKTAVPIKKKDGAYHCQHCDSNLKLSPVYEHFLKTHKTQ